jgi:hypothetical protein
MGVPSRSANGIGQLGDTARRLSRLSDRRRSLGLETASEKTHMVLYLLGGYAWNTATNCINCCPLIGTAPPIPF